MHDIRTGSIIFVRGKTIWSKGISLVTGSDITHTAIAINSRWVIDADGFRPVAIRPFDFKDYEVLDVGLGDYISPLAMHNAVHPYVHSNYDYLNIISQLLRHCITLSLPFLEIKNHYTCVELVCQILRDFGYSIDANQPVELYLKILDSLPRLRSTVPILKG